MKKPLLILITLCIATIGYSQTFIDANFIEYTVIPSTTNVQITDYDYANGGAIVNIPVTVDYNTVTYTVTEIGDEAFLAFGSSDKITSVIIPNGVTSIGYRSFQSNLLTSVTIPDSVTQISNLSFAENSLLISVVLSNNLTAIPNSSFASCALTNVNIPSGVTAINSNAFANNQLTSVTIPSNVTVIEARAFYGNPLTCIISENTIPPSVVTPTGANVSSDSFGNRSNINLSIPTGAASAYVTAQWTGFNSVAEVLNDTFVVDNITYQILPNPNNEVIITDYNTAGGTVVNILTTVNSACTDFSVVNIGNSAFENKGLTSVNMSNNITSIGQNAFRDNAITSLTLSDNVTFIGGTAFFNNQLTSVTLPNGLTNIAIASFANNLLTTITIPGNVTSIDQSAFRDNQLQSVTIGVGVLTIGSQAFMNNSLTNVVIPDNVTSIGTNAFTNNQLTSVTISANLTSIANQTFRNNQLTSVIIPNGVTSIGTSAFWNNQLTSVVIPNNVTSIGNNAFYDNNLTTVVIGDNVTTIGVSAFSLNNLTTITIPSSVTNISSIAFGNNSLTSIISLGMLPPTIVTGGSLDTFGNGNRSNIDLTIPTGALAAYVTNSGALWTGFNTVTEGTLSATDFELTNNIRVITTTNTIKVTYSNVIRLQNYTIYNISGVVVATGKESNIATNTLSRGIYILKLNFDKGAFVKKFVAN